MSFQNKYQILRSVTKPTRYLGNEINSIVKDWTKVKTKIALCFPDTYEIGMSHLGLKILYHYLNKNDDWCAERVYMPWLDMVQLLREKDMPLFALESGKPLNEFDIVGFSFQYELEYTNVLEMLDLGRIPVWAKDRKENDPIVMAGGPVVYNPEPMSLFIDAFLIGDGEEAFPEIIRSIEKLKNDGNERNSILREISKLTGVYVPAMYSAGIAKDSGFSLVKKPQSDDIPFPVKRSLLEDINNYPFPDEIIVPFGRIVHDRIAVELSRGCTQGCRFCQAGIIYRPTRDRDPESIVETIHKSISYTGYDEVSLSSLSSADYSGIEMLAEKLMNDLEGKDTALSISSLRVYGITEALAKQIARVRKTGFTVAPEAGSQRLRDIINKGITEEDIISGVTTAFSHGWTIIKLYLMIGLPGEVEEDVVAIGDLARKIIAIGRQKSGSRVKLNLSVNTFIPKPHTPFQWAELVPENVIRDRQRIILDAIKSDKSIAVSFNDYRLSHLEVVLSRGDRQLGQVIYEAWKNGAILDAWNEKFQPHVWDEAFSSKGIHIERYTNSIKVDLELPWDHINPRVEKEFLLDEYKKSLEAKITLPCEQPVLHSPGERVSKIKDGSNYVCYNCGIECDLNMIQHQQKKYVDYLEKAVRKKSEMTKSVPDIAPDQYNYLIKFSKTENMQFVSQLDFLKILTHSFRKACIAVSRSLGFNPRPRFWFPISLAVGVEGLNEYFGFISPEDFDLEEVKHKLNSTFPDGLRVSTVVKLTREETKKYKRMEELSYRLLLPEDGNEQDIIQDRIDELLREKSIIVERIVKKKKREVDIRPLLKEIKYDREKNLIDVICLITDTAGVRPENLTKIILDKDLAEIDVQRLWVS